MSDKRLRMPNSLGQFILKWTVDGQEARNVIYLDHHSVTADVESEVSDTWNDLDAADAASQLVGIYGGTLQALLNPNCSLYGCDWVWNETHPDGPLHEGSGTASAFAGTNTGVPLPSFCALAVHLGTGLGGRANNGRLYLPGLGEALIDAPDYSRIKPGSFSDFTAALNSLQVSVTPLGTIYGLEGNGYHAYQCVGSFYVPGSFVGTGNGILRDAAAFKKVTQMLLKDDIIDTMRSRKVGRGI